MISESHTRPNFDFTAHNFNILTVLCKYHKNLENLLTQLILPVKEKCENSNKVQGAGGEEDRKRKKKEWKPYRKEVDE